MNTINFDQATKHAATAFYLLRQRADNQAAFDRACDAMRREQYTADIKKGTLRSIDGVVAQFTNYDWSGDYADTPHFVFFDFFQGSLLNKYSRIMRGLSA